MAPAVALEKSFMTVKFVKIGVLSRRDAALTKGHKSLNQGPCPIGPENPAKPPLPREGHSAAKTLHSINFVTIGNPTKHPHHRESV